jgi:hypothetical protein
MPQAGIVRDLLTHHAEETCCGPLTAIIGSHVRAGDGRESLSEWRVILPEGLARRQFPTRTGACGSNLCTRLQVAESISVS